MKLFLEYEDFKSAREYSERVLDQDPENGEAYFLRLLAEKKLKNADGLETVKRLQENKTFQLAFRFADPELKTLLEKKLSQIKIAEEQRLSEETRLAEEQRLSEETRLAKAKTVFKKVAIFLLIGAAVYGVFYAYTHIGEKKPLDYIEEAAKQGDAIAQFGLGLCYFNGDGVPQDDKEAVKWYRKAAEQGFAEAQFGLGLCYANGDGVPQDYPEAAKWFRKAAEQGGCNSAGLSWFVLFQWIWRTTRLPRSGEMVS